jgi:hypothetical protein
MKYAAMADWADEKQPPAQFNEHTGIGASLHRPHIPGVQHFQQLDIGRLKNPAQPDPLITCQHLETGAIDNQTGHQYPFGHTLNAT